MEHLAKCYVFTLQQSSSGGFCLVEVELVLLGVLGQVDLHEMLQFRPQDGFAAFNLDLWLQHGEALHPIIP